jgi:hypothetical protein
VACFLLLTYTAAISSAVYRRGTGLNIDISTIFGGFIGGIVIWWVGCVVIAGVGFLALKALHVTSHNTANESALIAYSLWALVLWGIGLVSALG